MGSGGKKKKVAYVEEPREDDVSSDDQKKEENDEIKCPHVGQAVSLPTIKKATKTSWARIGLCGPCAKDKRTHGKSLPSSDIWMCLKCGVQCCKNHVRGHFTIPRSDLHCVALKVTEWVLHCHLCQRELYVDSYKKLRDSVVYVKKVNEVKGLDNVDNASSIKLAKDIQLPKVRGLSNLGNTCFFNAVIQCLAQSHPLSYMLDLHSQKGVSFSIAANDVLEPLNLQLLDSGGITLSLTAFLKEMNSVGKSGVYNPSHLFGQVCRRSPQFRGYHQEDAHELLRQLLEALKGEEVKRQKSAILKHFGLSEKTDPKVVGTSIRKKLQALNRHSNHTVVDKLFGGQLVSTIVCEQCHNSSQIYEPFLDISLPLIEEKTPRPKQTYEDDEESSSVSCFRIGKKSKNEDKKSQNRKEKEKNKKEKRKNKKRKKKIVINEEEMVNAVSQDEIDPPNNDANESEETLNKEVLLNGDVKDDATVDPKNDCNELDYNEKEVEFNEDLNMSGIPKLETEVTHKLSELKINAITHKKSENYIKKMMDRKSGPKDGDEEDDEDSEEGEEWEWDYGEPWNQEHPKENHDGVELEDDQISECIQPNQPIEKQEVPLVSLNPISPEVIAEAARTALSERDDETPEKAEEDDETGASSNGDVEDNLEQHISVISEPFHPDARHLDPHMERLSRKVRRLSVATSALEIEEHAQREYTVTPGDEGGESEPTPPPENNPKSRLQNDWVARSLTSIAPRYSCRSAGECSLYSCLAQFTAPELLTGNNKWACDKCSRLQGAKSDSDSNGQDLKSVYSLSNASKQLLIFCPPAILTIHLKRFQQTMYSLRKINKHVTFPDVLDLASFCSSTSVSTPTVSAGVSAIKYYLFGVVEHSGRLQGGHYTAYVKVRPSHCQEDFNRFYSSPTVRNDEINHLLADIERKYREHASKLLDTSSEVPCPSEPHKWYHVSDSCVAEVSDDKVMKSQAYILFYERFH